MNYIFSILKYRRHWQAYQHTLKQERMKVVFLLALIVFVNSGEIKSDRGVQVLEKDTFKTFVNDNKHVLVQFCELTERSNTFFIFLYK